MPQNIENQNKVKIIKPPKIVHSFTMLESVSSILLTNITVFF